MPPPKEKVYRGRVAYESVPVDEADGQRAKIGSGRAGGERARSCSSDESDSSACDESAITEDWMEEGYVAPSARGILQSEGSQRPGSREGSREGSSRSGADFHETSPRNLGRVMGKVQVGSAEKSLSFEESMQLRKKPGGARRV